MIILMGLIAIVPALLMVIGVVSVFRAGIRYGKHKERRTKGR